MRSITFVSTSRSDFATIFSIIELSKLTEKVKINLLICKDIAPKINKKKLNIIEINTSVMVDKSDKLQLEKELSDSLSKISIEFSKTVVFLVGDRWETLYVAYECLLLNLPVIHHSGGDITNGAIDNQIRDAITSLSDYHLTSNELHSKRLIKLGESKNKVLTVGEPVLLKLKNEIEKSKVFKNIYGLKSPFVLACFHSSTLEEISYEEQAFKIIKILDQISYDIIITYPNMDPGGLFIHEELKRYAAKNNNKITYVEKLEKNYFSHLINCLCLIGNSSSGILEANLASKISINIGNRQNGRLRSKSIVDVPYSEKEFSISFEGIKEKYKELSHNDFNSPYFMEESINLIEEFLINICLLKNINKIKVKNF